MYHAKMAKSREIRSKEGRKWRSEREVSKRVGRQVARAVGGDHAPPTAGAFEAERSRETQAAKLMVVPMFSPRRARAMFPCSDSWNTRMGSLLSRQSVTAVVSMTPILWARNSS